MRTGKAPLPVRSHGAEEKTEVSSRLESVFSISRSSWQHALLTNGGYERPASGNSPGRYGVGIPIRAPGADAAVHSTTTAVAAAVAAGVYAADAVTAANAGAGAADVTVTADEHSVNATAAHPHTDTTTPGRGVATV
ncbi:GM18801 [Drosophila sechellia]|uniref:GM18801 n=1 Tax=Drosophila sechellia TaxID=7238 RepID=B4ILM2_DROSE|nr:GM18801 [Drosophila sechellia]